MIQKIHIQNGVQIWNQREILKITMHPIYQKYDFDLSAKYSFQK